MDWIGAAVLISSDTPMRDQLKPTCAPTFWIDITQHLLPGVCSIMPEAPSISGASGMLGRNLNQDAHNP